MSEIPHVGEAVVELFEALGVLPIIFASQVVEHEHHNRVHSIPLPNFAPPTLRRTCIYCIIILYTLVRAVFQQKSKF